MTTAPFTLGKESELPIVRKCEVQTGGSVLSASEPHVHFGLAEATHVERLTDRWPHGTVETVE
jgi:ASPIC and UnbV